MEITKLKVELQKMKLAETSTLNKQIQQCQQENTMLSIDLNKNQNGEQNLSVSNLVRFCRCFHEKMRFSVSIIALYIFRLAWLFGFIIVCL